MTAEEFHEMLRNMENDRMVLTPEHKEEVAKLLEKTSKPAADLVRSLEEVKIVDVGNDDWWIPIDEIEEGLEIGLSIHSF